MLTTTEQRRRIMSKIRSKDTKPELALRKALRSFGILGYRKNLRGLRGTPDIVFTKYKVVVFVDGDFWHGHDFDVWKNRLAHGNNGSFWVDKIQRNITRDLNDEIDLKSDGWTVIRFWESDVMKNVDACVDVILETLRGRGYEK